MELKEFFGVILKKWWLIAIIVIAAMIGSFIKSYYFTTPIYAANAKLLVNQFSGDGSTTVNAGTIQASINLINTYKEIIRSSAVMNKVVEQYPELGKTAAQLSSQLVVTSANNSQVMNLIFQDISYAQASTTVNAVAAVFKEQIPKIMNVENITILSEADTTISPSPINLNTVMNLLISFMVSLLLALGLVFLLDYLDNTLKTEVEITEIMDVPVLAVVGKISKGDLKQSARARALQNQKGGEGQYATLNS